jgi:hypothetical protein
MKKIIIAFCLILSGITIFSQTCEQRESKLLESLGGFSAAALYNTFAALGGIADGYGNTGYDSVTVFNLVGEQKRLIENLVKLLDELKSGNYLKDTADTNFVSSISDTFNGLKKQAELLLDYIKTKKRTILDSYDDQRSKNWKEISKIMGIEDK